jgi:hypothetical protein
VPAAARAHTKAGAEAFVRFYIDLVNEASIAPLAGVVVPLSDTGCVACKNIEADLQDLVAKDRRYAQRALAIQGLGPVTETGDGQWVLPMTLRQSATDILDSSGQRVDVVQAQTFRRSVAVVWRVGRWVMFGMQ